MDSWGGIEGGRSLLGGCGQGGWLNGVARPLALWHGIRLVLAELGRERLPLGSHSSRLNLPLLGRRCGWWP